MKWFKNNLENFTKKCVENEKGDRTLKVDDVVEIIEQSVATIFPRVLNTGIAHIDQRNRNTKDEMYLPWETAHLSEEEKFANRKSEILDFDDLYKPPIHDVTGFYFDLIPTFLTVYFGSIIR